MTSNYIAKSIKGLSIISNLNVEESCVVNTNITTETIANIGSVTNPFNNLYVKNILPTSVVTNLITTNQPLNITSGNLSLDYNTNEFYTSIGNLNINQDFIKTLYTLETTGNFYNSSQFQLTSNTTGTTVNILNSYPKSLLSSSDPITYNNITGSFGLNIDTTLQISNGNLKVIDYKNATYPIYYNSIYQNFSLKYASPLTVNSGDLSLNYSDPFTTNSGNLSLKVASFTNLLGYSTSNLFITNGSLDINYGNIFVGQGLKKYSAAELIALGYPTTDANLTYIGMKINTNIFTVGETFLDLLPKSPGAVPFYGQDTFYSTDTSFTYNDITKTLKTGYIQINPTTIATPNNYAASCGYVNNKNSYLTDTPIYYTSDGDTNVWNIRYDLTSIKVNAQGQLTSNLSVAPNQPIGLNPESQLTFDYKVSQFRVVDGLLNSTLIGLGCINLNPENELSLSYEPDYLTIEGTLLTFSSAFIDDYNTNSNKIKTNTDQIKANGDLIKTNTDNIKVNSDSIKVNSDSIKVNSDSIKVNSEAITSIDSDLSGLNSTVSALSTDVGVIDGDIIAINSALATQQTEILAAGLSGILGSLLSFFSGGGSGVKLDIEHNTDGSIYFGSGGSAASGNFSNCVIGNLTCGNAIIPNLSTANLSFDSLNLMSLQSLNTSISNLSVSNIILNGYPISTIFTNISNNQAFSNISISNLKSETGTNFSNVNNNITNINNTILGINSTIGNINSTIGSINSTILGINSTIGSLETQISTNNLSISSSISNLYTETNLNSFLISGLSTSNTFINNSISNLQTNQINIISTIGNINNSISNLYSEISTNSILISNLSTSVSTSLNLINNSISSLITNVSTNSHLISTNSTSLSSLNITTSNLQTNLSLVNSSISNLYTNFSITNTSINSLITNFNNSIGNINTSFSSSNTVYVNTTISNFVNTNSTISNFVNTNSNISNLVNANCSMGNLDVQNIRLGNATGDSNNNYFISSGGQININANNDPSADNIYTNLILSAGSSSNNNNHNISFVTKGVSRINIDQNGLVSIGGVINSTISNGTNFSGVNNDTGSANNFISLMPNMGISNNNSIIIGRSFSNLDSAIIQYNNNASNSVTNTLGFGFYNANNLLTIDGNGNSSIKASLQIKGSKVINSTGLYLEHNRDTYGSSEITNQGNGKIYLSKSDTSNTRTQMFQFSSNQIQFMNNGPCYYDTMGGAHVFGITYPADLIIYNGSTMALSCTEGNVVTNNLQVQGSRVINSQGAYIEWNRSGGGGELEITNQHAGGSDNSIYLSSSDSSNNRSKRWKFGANIIQNLVSGNTVYEQVANTGAHIFGYYNAANFQVYNASGLAFRVESGTVYANTSVTTTATISTVTVSAVRINGSFSMDSSSNFSIDSTGSAGGRLSIDTNSNLILSSANYSANTGYIQSNSIRCFNFGQNNYFGITPGQIGFGNGLVNFGGSGPAGTQWCTFYDQTSAIGSIFRNNGGGTTFSVTSDYRVKTNIKPLSNSLNIICKLEPKTYNMFECEIESTGFIAHELEAILPNAVFGKKDAMEEDGKRPKYQQVDTLQIVPFLVGSIQEQQLEIESLKERLDKLETQLNK